jgi:hypothetical protein
MDDPLPFPQALLPEQLVPGLCFTCGLLTDIEALKEYISSAVSSRVSAAVDRFLSNNHPLPSETREEISSSLEPNTALLEKVDEAVAQLSDLLENLKATRDILADRVQRSRFVLHPLRILPDECLSNIFSHCATLFNELDDSVFSGIPLQICANDPWALGSTSHHWRDVVLNTPKVWSNVVIDLNSAGEKARWKPSTLSALNLLLTRSATHPLNVVIHSMYSFSVKHPLLQGVMAHCQRWRRLYLSVPIMRFMFLQQIYHNLPLLDHLSIEYLVKDYSTLFRELEDVARAWDSFHLAKNLQSISVWPMTIRDAFQYCPQFANQIKKYRSMVLNPNGLPALFRPCTYLRALRKLPNLEEWTASCQCDNSWPSETDNLEFEEEGGTVVMDALRSIRLKETEGYWGAIAQVLDHMSAPSLTELILEGNLDECCISSVIGFVDQSHCTHKIKTLTLIDVGRNRGATPLIPLLSNFPCLIELSLQYASLPPLPPPPLPAQINLMDDEVDLLSRAEEVLPKRLEILVLSDETRLDGSILDGVRGARPSLKIRKVDRLEIT